ncbi:hypothetical protein PV328_000856 [Microctonus aethiopoides]|uniref:N-acetyltransferase domain-containing protein n=1 Tax=Microctonus aethiopoides TaxID=144406 RepID=A0AA39FWH2_9HYME|nr:hypothetical protein PV328_000856 [Microctonus aethiopoides]
MGWTRPSTPPRVWRNLELINSDGKLLQISIQDIPKDRFIEVLEHMSTSFVHEEAMISSIRLWSMSLEQGMSVGAFVKNNTGEQSKLAGLNILVVVDDEIDKKFKSQDISRLKAKNFFEFIFTFSAEGDPRTIFNVDLYLTALGLSVLSNYRGLGLGKHLLEIRNDIGREYNINYTETLFTSIVSQKIAASVGFEVYLDRAYDDIIDENGKKIFPSLSGKRIKIMIKKLI